MPSQRARQITRRQTDFLRRAFFPGGCHDGYLEAWMIGSRTGRSESAARSALKRLEAHGLVECEEPSPQKWSLTDAGREAL